MLCFQVFQRPDRGVLNELERACNGLLVIVFLLLALVRGRAFAWLRRNEDLGCADGRYAHPYHRLLGDDRPDKGAIRRIDVLLRTAVCVEIRDEVLQTIQVASCIQ